MSSFFVFFSTNIYVDYESVIHDYERALNSLLLDAYIKTVIEQDRATKSEKEAERVYKRVRRKKNAR